ncbi:hypothetical protein ACFQZC_25995 [Streptacidiphilus monticola]
MTDTVPEAPPAPWDWSTPSSVTGADPASRSRDCCGSWRAAAGVSAYQGTTW